MVTTVPGRGLITTTPADRAINLADQRRAIGARYRAVTKVIALGARRVVAGWKLELPANPKQRN
jgi:hypothetical protein